jgi:hypothetical protein
VPKRSALEYSLNAQIAAHESWARTTDRAARTAKARAALEDRFLTEAGGDPVKAKSLRSAFFARMQLKSAQSRRKAKEARAEADRYEAMAEEAETELNAGGGG